MSLDPVRETVAVSSPEGGPDGAAFRRMLGPAYLVAVDNMDLGNWAMDLAVGSRYGFRLLWVVVLSSLMAMACHRLLPSRWRLPL